ncbi:MAG: InlB B-repeat-containing protein [Victivallales bacterium]|jgi:hypothetical protein
MAIHREIHKALPHDAPARASAKAGVCRKLSVLLFLLFACGGLHAETGSGTSDLFTLDTRFTGTLTVVAGVGGTTNPPSASNVTVKTNTASPIRGTAKTGYHFENWTLNGSALAVDVNLPSTDAFLTGTEGCTGTVTANFAINNYAVTFAEGANGTIAGTKVQNINHGSNCSEVTAVPNEGYHFVNWTGGYSGTLNPLTISNVTADKTITANFAINTYSVAFAVTTNGSIAGTKNQSVIHGAACSPVTPVPAPNCHFTGWTGDYTGSENPLTLSIITKTMTVVANFAKNTAKLTVNNNGNGSAGFSLVNPLTTAATIPITASAYANNHFDNWTVTDGSAIIANPKSAATTVKLTGGHGSSVTITANFANDTVVPTTLPAAPVVSATDGTYEDRVVITWKAVAGATSYDVYRNSSNSTTGVTDPIGTTADCIFEDNSKELNDANPGTPFYYFAIANNEVGPSKFSTGNSGYVAKAPAVPGAVTASDSTYFEKIRISWAKVVGATSYKVFRTEAAAPAPNPNLDTNKIGETSALFLDDFGDKIAPPPGDLAKKYYYWIAAKNENAITAISKPNDGCLSKKGPATVTASNGAYSNRIVVTWTVVPGATAYEVHRSNPKLQGEQLIDTVTDTTECEDKAVTAGITYYYRVKAKYGANYDSDPSVTVAAGKAAGASNPTATDILNAATSASQAGEKGSSVYFAMEVPPGIARLVATLSGTSKALANDCNLFAKFANYPTPTSSNAKGVETLTNEVLTVSNPAAGTWYFLLYGATGYKDVTLTVNCYSVTDIVLTQIPLNDLAVPFTAAFKGRVVDEAGTGIPNIALQVRNPITGLTSTLAKTDAKGVFSYSAPIGSEGEHTFDFFFTEMPDPAKGTASHTVATRKGCLLEGPGNFFDFSAYIPASPVALATTPQNDLLGMQTFLAIRNGWDIAGTVASGDTYETMWINSTLVKAKDDAQLLAKADEGLYMLLYGIEGAGAGNDTTADSALSAVPFAVHVDGLKKADVLTALNTLGVLDGTQKAAIEGGAIGIVVVSSLSNPLEATDHNYNISLLAREQLDILAKLAAGSGGSVEARDYSGVAVKKVMLTLANGRQINVVATVFVK